MSQIDLKYAVITIRDGYSGPGGSFLVNNMGGYSAAAVTMVIDGGTGEVEIGNIFTVVGDSGEHTVTAHSETLSNTTSITFTPALTGTVADDAAITFLPHRLEVNISEGNCQYTEKRNMQYKLNRGILSEVREGDQVPVEVKMDYLWDFLTAAGGSGTPTVEDAFKQRGEASTWVSSDPDACQPYAVDVVIDYTPPCATEYKETITLADFRWEQLDHDPKQGQVAVSGKCNITQADIDRTAQ